MLVLCLLLSAGARVAAPVPTDDKEREAAARLTELGASLYPVAYFEMKLNPRVKVREDGRCVSASLGGSWKGSVKDFALLKDLPLLKDVCFCLPDEDLYAAQLQSLPRLESVTFIGDSFTDRGM